MRLVSRKEDTINTPKTNFKRCNHSLGQGKLNIVGIGPGSLSHLSLKARNVIAGSQVVVGYLTYIRLLGTLLKGKEVISSGMTREIERAKIAIKKALQGMKVCVISSGDAGIYGMAGLILELLKAGEAKRLKLEIVPGITAASACASLLGAPLAKDFAVISLSDLLICRQEIERKLKAALKADFVIALYNPQSKSRTQPLKTALRLTARYRPPNTPVGIARNAYRQGQLVEVIPLKEAALFKNIDMAATLIIGNSQTFVKNGYMITPRGYDIRKETRNQ